MQTLNRSFATGLSTMEKSEKFCREMYQLFPKVSHANSMTPYYTQRREFTWELFAQKLDTAFKLVVMQGDFIESLRVENQSLKGGLMEAQREVKSEGSQVSCRPRYLRYQGGGFSVSECAEVLQCCFK